MPIISGILELIPQCLYDQITVGPTNSHYHLFRDPIGTCEASSDRIKTFLQTNQYLPAMLPAPHKFLATRLNALFLRDGKPVLLSETNLYGQTDILFSIMEKSYWRGPAWLCASPFAIFGVPKDQIPRLKPDFGIEWEKLGAPLMSDVEYPGYKPGHKAPKEISGVLIDTHMPFEVCAGIHTQSAPGFELAVHLDGILARRVV